MQLFREFAEKEVKPLAQEVDETEIFPRGTVEKMAKAGFMGIPVETCRFIYLYGSLADLFGNRFYLLYGFIRCVQSCNYLYQFHNGSRIEEVRMKVGIIGAGTMGSGIAQAFAQTEGYEVFLCDINGIGRKNTVFLADIL